MTLLQAIALEPILPGPQVLMALAQRRQRGLGLGVDPLQLEQWRIAKGALSWTGDEAKVALVVVGLLLGAGFLYEFLRKRRRPRLHRNPRLTTDRIVELRAQKRQIKQEIHDLVDEWPPRADFQRRLDKLYLQRDLVDELLARHFGD